MVQTDSRRRYDPSTIKLTSYFSLCGQWNPFIFGQLLRKFLCDLRIMSSSNTMRNPSLETKSRQRVSQHRISRHMLRKCLGSSEHSCGVIPLSLFGTYCWGHSPALTNHNYVFKMTPLVCQWRLVRSGTPYLVRVCAYLQGGSDLQGGADLKRGLALTCLPH